MLNRLRPVVTFASKSELAGMNTEAKTNTERTKILKSIGRKHQAQIFLRMGARQLQMRLPAAEAEREAAVEAVSQMNLGDGHPPHRPGHAIRSCSISAATASLSSHLPTCMRPMISPAAAWRDEDGLDRAGGWVPGSRPGRGRYFLVRQCVAGRVRGARPARFQFRRQSLRR